MPKKSDKRINWVQLFQTLFLLIGAFVMIVPFAWMLSTAFKIPSQVLAYPPTFIPRSPTVRYFIKIFTELDFERFILNSTYISILITLAIMFTSSLIGYVLAKFRFWGQNIVFLGILSTMMIPFAVTMIPLFLMMQVFHWRDTHFPLIIPSLCSTFGIFLVKQFMHTIPDELIDAARIDGCSEFRIFFVLILPLSKPILAALTIFTFMWSWDRFVWPLIILENQDLFTLPVGLATFSQEFWADYGLVMAGATITVLPVLGVFLVVQKRFIQGITLTGLKM